MKQLLILGVITSFFIDFSIKPVNAIKTKYISEELGEEALGIEYERYMREVLATLEDDEYFAAKLNETDNKNIWEIGSHLQFVANEVRSKLNELKRNEMGRLRMLHKKMESLERKEKGNKKADFRDGFAKQNLVGHVDHSNHEIFGRRDIENLIEQSSSDLKTIKRQKKKEFKQYEMKKELLRRKRLTGLSQEERQEIEKRTRESQARHRDHPALHEPGHEAQLKEVWDEEHEDQEFNPKTFFIEHDLNGDGLLDEEEVETLFLKEVAKMYSRSNDDDDMVEAYHEMYKMAVYTVHEVDKDNDGFLSMDEFIDHATKNPNFSRDEKWKALDETQVFTEEEYLEFEREFEEKHPAKPKNRIKLNEL